MIVAVDNFVPMIESIRSLRSLLDSQGFEPRIMELRRGEDCIELDIERNAVHTVTKSIAVNGHDTFTLQHHKKPGTYLRIAFVDGMWLVGPQLLGKGIL